MDPWLFADNPESAQLTTVYTNIHEQILELTRLLDF